MTREKRPVTARPLDASMSLIDQMMHDTVDAGYAEAAARRGRRGVSSALRGSWVLLVALVVVGLVLSTAASQVRARAGLTMVARDRLVAEIEERNGALDRLQGQLEQLRGDLVAARQEALSLTGTGESLADRLTLLETVTGVAPVVGPGLRVTLDDAPAAEDTTSDVRDGSMPDDGRVLDYDLQRLVNALWESGAEAVTINGRRLTALSAIRLAGEAIVVDYRPLTRPYVVQAVGDPDRLEAGLAETEDGRYVRSLEENYGIMLDISQQEQMRLAGASGVTLRQVQPGESFGPEAAEGDPS